VERSSEIDSAGLQAKLYVSNMAVLSLVMQDLKGRNALLLAESELTGGWGFICRFDDMNGIR
jgi:hypothetical protein